VLSTFDNNPDSVLFGNFNLHDTVPTLNLVAKRDPDRKTLFSNFSYMYQTASVTRQIGMHGTHTLVDHLFTGPSFASRKTDFDLLSTHHQHRRPKHRRFK
jgi:hypothetical protein